ncbi:MAG: hypothetical protein KatS3mg015_1072 [Fimbriimonadales bacterium]|nr:MAG: hypothetical protein KatS3mg015_1072 [Fimbriimonadales bacterium]
MNRLMRGMAWSAVLIAATMISASSIALPVYPQDVKILKAAEEPRVLVQYNKARAAKIELRINGVVAGQRVVDASRTSGEVSFALDLNLLREGQNVVEAILFDAKGELIKAEKIVLDAEREQQAVFISFPKANETVQGTVEVRVGFGKEIQGAFVSFFVDGEFRSLRNFPPYTYLWDTRKETNGWHELEAWVYDRTQTTMKSQKTRVFVDNPGGRTERRTQVADPTAPTIAPPTGGSAGLKGAQGAAEGAVGAPTVSEVKGLSAQAIHAPVEKGVGVKSRDTLYAEAVGIRVTDPKPVTVPPTAVKAPAASESAATESSNLIPVTFGTRLPDGVYVITLNGEVIPFDVQPFVEDGIPLTPLRHLFEHAGAEVSWVHEKKIAEAHGLKEVRVRIGDVIATVDGKPVQLEYPAFIKRGRTIIPLSFVREALDVEVSYDKGTGHVLITKPSEKG